MRDPVACAAAIILLLIVLAALLAPWIAPHDPYLTTRRRLLPPVWEARGNWQHLLGTDNLGRDMLSRLLYGTRATLMIGIAATLIGGAVGIAVGLAAAYYRRLDGVLMRVNDVLLSMPAILLGLTLAAVVGPGMIAIVAALAVATVPTVARVTRAARRLPSWRRISWRRAARSAAGQDPDLALSRAQLHLAGARLPDAALRPDDPDRRGPVVPRARRTGPAARSSA